jgi:serine/threonine-protein kinase HipA
MIRVWSDGKRAGVLDRLGAKGSTFAYDPSAAAQRSVSVTMPVRIPSYDLKFGLLPIFEMNLPEGALRERLTRRFAKATGTFDDFDLLQIVGRTQIGRIRYSSLDQDLAETVPFQSIDAILRARRDDELFDYLLDEFAAHSGISGVQPKVMIRAREEVPREAGIRQSPSILSATHIVKLWDEEEFPELAANEYFCLEVAKRLGLSVPPFVLSDDGGALIVERFDLVDNKYIGFEDFCVLNALGTADKYKGGYETRVFRRMRDFVSVSEVSQSLEELFRLFALNCAIRNGDAHLKNFGITYADIDGVIKNAPVYDVVTTWAYVPKDPMALTLDGSTRWPDRKALVRLGQTRSDLNLKRVEEHMEATADAVSSVAPDLKKYFASKEGEVGLRMLGAWETGIKDSLGEVRNLHRVRLPKKSPSVPRLAKSDGVVLEALRQNGGRLTGTLKSIAEGLSIPQSTMSASVKRLVDKGFIKRGSRSIALLPREV